MNVLLDMSGTTLECRVPTTAAEVLDFRVRIRCITDPTARLLAARQWFFEHVLDSPAELPEWPKTDEEELPGSIWLYAACETLISRACLSEDVIRDVVRLEDRKNGIAEDWRPRSKCDCVQCRWDPRDGPMPELPPEHECLFGGLDPRAALVVSEVSGVEDLSQPYWLVQARAALQVAQWRRWRHEAEERERKDTERPEWLKAASQLGDLLRGGRRD